MTLKPILESRFSEAMQCLKNDAPLAAIFPLRKHSGRTFLYSAATSNHKKFNEAQNSPKDGSGKVKKCMTGNYPNLLMLLARLVCFLLM